MGYTVLNISAFRCPGRLPPPQSHSVTKEAIGITYNFALFSIKSSDKAHWIESVYYRRNGA